MSWHIVVVMCGAVLSGELMIKLPLRSRFVKLLSLLHWIFRMMMSAHISDHWKEKAMVIYARHLFVLGVSLSVLCVLACMPLVLCLFYLSGGAGQMFEIRVSPGIVFLSALVPVVYSFLRTR